MRKSLALVDNERYVIYFATIVSILLSLWIVLKSAIINPDGVCYLQSAATLKSSGLMAAMHVCAQAKWPFYASLIYLTSAWLYLDNLTAAHVVNALFSIISAVTFILIVKELGGRQSILWFAAIVVLGAHQFSNLRDSIIRDHGYWAFYLVSLYCLLRFYHYPQWRSALAFSVSVVVATLFRIEGIFFLIGIPLSTLFYRQYSLKRKFQLFFMLNTVTFLFVIGCVLLFLLHPEMQLKQLGRLQEVLSQFQQGIALVATRLVVLQQTLTTYVLPKEANNIQVILTCLLMSLYFACLMFNLSFIYSVLTLYAWTNKLLRFPKGNSSLAILISYIVINLGITVVFFIQNLFLSSRYLIALSLVLMLWVPFALGDIFAKAQRLIRYRLYAAAASLLMLISFFGVMVNFGITKAYLRDAGIWLAKNVPNDAQIYSDNERLMFYSQHFGGDLFAKLQTYKSIELFKNNNWQQFDYIALKLNDKKRRDMSNAENLGLIRIRVFTNRRGDGVVIYKKKSSLEA